MLPDGRGGLYLVSPVRTLHLPRGEKDPQPFAERGSSAGAVARGPDGTLYLGRGSSVLRVDARGEVTIVAKGFEQVFGIALDVRGRLLVTDWETGAVVRLDGDQREVLATGLEYPSGVVIDARGRIYVKESGRQTHEDMRIQRIDEEGRLELFATVPSISRWR